MYAVHINPYSVPLLRPARVCELQLAWDLNLLRALHNNSCLLLLAHMLFSGATDIADQKLGHDVLATQVGQL
jgi:hypothetical protein